MKNTLCTATVIFGLSAVLGSTQLKAQVVEKGNIPFAFQASGVTLAPGSYTVSRAGHDNGTIKLQNEETGAAVFVMANIRKPGKGGRASIVFHRYGTRVFLSELWFPEDSTGHAVAPSKLEREMASDQGGVKVLYIAMR